jgi:hypothetical protein
MAAMKLSLPTSPIGLGLLAAGLFLAYITITKRAGQSIAGAAGSAVVQGAGEFGVGVVVGVGEVVGVPPTDTDKCAQAIKNGSLWDVSLYCPASDYVAEAWKRKPSIFGSSSIN